MAPFETFVDAEDLTACTDARESVGELNARLRPLGCYFPLGLDEDQPLGELFLQSSVCSRSFRYGKLGDNVLGLQWSLPNGASLRLGGRVVKNVTGFDLVRFLSASQGRLGRPKALVLRLRPLAQAEKVLCFTGPWKNLGELASTVRASSWAHALDALDLVSHASLGQVYASFSGKPETIPHFEAASQNWARQFALSCEVATALPLPGAACWARLQAPLGLASDIAADWIQRHGNAVHAFLGQGLIQLGEPDHHPATAEKDLLTLHQVLGAMGGQVEHPSIPTPADSPQARWEAGLATRLQELA